METAADAPERCPTRTPRDLHVTQLLVGGATVRVAPVGACQFKVRASCCRLQKS